MDNDNIVQVIQSNTTSYNLPDLDKEDLAEWRRVTVKNARAKWMRKIREKAGVLKKLKRELMQVHKLSQTESGFPGIHLWHLKCWDEDLGLKVKKEEPMTPTLLSIKVKSPPHTKPKIPITVPYHPFFKIPLLTSKRFQELGRSSYHLKINSHCFVHINNSGIWYFY